MSDRSDVVVVGGGIIGCAVAWELLQAGMTVTIVDRGEPGLEASHAAAGMLAFQSNGVKHAATPLGALCRDSQEGYAAWVDALVERSGVAVGYQTTGCLLVAFADEEVEALAHTQAQHRAAGFECKPLSGDTLAEFERGLSRDVLAGIFLPHDHHVENRELMQALVAAVRAAGGQFRANEPVLSVESQSDTAAVVRTQGGEIESGVVVNAAGAWTALVDHGAVSAPPVEAVRGEMALMQVDEQPLGHVVHRGDCYLVPWPDGRVFVGSTSEWTDHKQVTAEGIRALVEQACQLAPALLQARVVETWSGLRPWMRDELPVLGRTSSPNVIVASGHYRNGILLAPITGRVIADLIVNGSSDVDLMPFSPERFGAEEE